MSDSNDRKQCFPLLMAGSAGLSSMAEDADQLGLSVSRVDASKVEAANDSMSRVGAISKGIFNNLTIAVAPFIDWFATALSDVGRQANGIGGVIDTVMGYAVTSVSFLVNAWDGLRLVWATLKIGLGTLASVFYTVGDGIMQMVQGIGIGFQRMWDLVKAAGELAGNSFKLVFDALQVPIGHFVAFVGTQLAAMIDQAALSVAYLDGELARKMQNAASAISMATMTAGIEAEEQLVKSVAAVKD